MKTSFRVLLASVMLVPAAVFAASFEGKVSFEMSSGRGEPQQITYNIKGDKVRMEMPGQKGVGGMIMDTTKKEMIVLMDEQKTYMVMALPDVAAEAIEKRGEEVTLEKTGETEKILGYTATKYISTHDGKKTELWLAEGLGTFMGFNNNAPGGRRKTAPQAWERALAGKELFPLRVIGREKSGKESFRMEATAIDKTSLPDSMFVPPPGYQKFDMGGMMKGIMKGMMPGKR